MKKYTRVYTCVLMAILSFLLMFALCACDMNSINEYLYGKEKEEEKKEDEETECDHNFQLSTNGVRPTCVTEGYDVYICTKCGEEKIENYRYGDHEYQNNVCIYCGADSPALSTFRDGDVTVLVYYASGVWASSDELQYQVVIKGNGNLSPFSWREYKGAIRTVKITGTDIGIPADMFSGETVLNEITVTGSLASIGDNAFSGCVALQEVVLPEGIKKIGDRAFAGCIYLEKVSIGSTLNSIGKYVFEGCESITEMALPFVGSGDRIGANACFGSIFSPGTADRFDQVCGEEYFVLPERFLTLTLNGSYDIITNGFSELKTPIETLVLSKDIAAVQTNAFFNNRGLQKIEWEEGSTLSVVERYAFTECRALEEFLLPAGVACLEEGAFSRCDVMKKFGFAENSVLTEIKAKAFLNCGELTSILLPSSVTTVGAEAFNGCSHLVSVRLNENLTYLGERAFKNCTSLKDVYVLSGTIVNGNGNSLLYYFKPDVWIEENVVVGETGYVRENYECLISDKKTTVSGYVYYCWTAK